jgi:8-oxo-dGTP pyrophosphatase MutT (NUDIX family)
VSLAETIRAQLDATAHAPAPFTGEDPSRSGLTLAPAAVLVGIVDRPEPGLLLTRRTETLRRHPGQVAFPGGRADPEDASAEDTALREAWEEVALPREAVTLVGRDATFHTPTGFSIIPVIGVLAPDLPLVAREDEVAAIFEVPLAHVLDRANQVRKSAEFGGVTREFHEILWQEFRIWGVTAAMIVNLTRRLQP